MERTTAMQEPPKVDAKSFRRRFLRWTQRWAMIEEHDETQKNLNDAIEAVNLGRLLQATGYRLRAVNRFLPGEMTPVPGLPEGRSGCRVTVECCSSGMRYEFDGSTPSCECPPPETGEGNSWEISGRGPGGQLDISGNTSIPEMDCDLSTTIADVINAVLIISSPRSGRESLSASNSSVDSVGEGGVWKTPSANIVVTTPGAPVASRLSPPTGTIHGRFRSLDTLTSMDESERDLPAPGELTPKTEAGIDADARKKRTSHSSPAVCMEFETDTSAAENFERSDTFVLEDDLTLEDKRAIAPSSPASDSSQPGELIRNLKEARRVIEGAFDVAIDTIRLGRSNTQTQAAFEDDASFTRRLSGGVGCFPGLIQPTTSSIRSAASRLSNLRRCAAATPSKPMSSRANASPSTTRLPLPSSDTRVKSASATDLRNPSGGGRVTAKRTPGGSAPKKSPVLKAPCSSSNFPKSPSSVNKYAHVKSTIPKMAPGKKRKDQ